MASSSGGRIYFQPDKLQRLCQDFIATHLTQTIAYETSHDLLELRSDAFLPAETAEGRMKVHVSLWLLMAAKIMLLILIIGRRISVKKIYWYMLPTLSISKFVSTCKLSNFCSSGILQKLVNVLLYVRLIQDRICRVRFLQLVAIPDSGAYLNAYLS